MFVPFLFKSYCSPSLGNNVAFFLSKATVSACSQINGNVGNGPSFLRMCWYYQYHYKGPSFTIMGNVLLNKESGGRLSGMHLISFLKMCQSLNNLQLTCHIMCSLQLLTTGLSPCETGSNKPSQTMHDIILN